LGAAMRVTILDDFSSGKDANVERLRGDVTVVRGDVIDANLRQKALAHVAGVFHEAAVASVPASIADPVRCNAVNVDATLALLEDARLAGIRGFVLASSAAAYGDNPALPKHESMRPEPMSPYAVSKVAGEHYVSAYAHLHGMHAVALRYFNIFGPHQDPASEYAAVVPRFLSRLLSGTPLTLYGDGEQTRDFCFVDNVAQANLLAMGSATAKGAVINVAAGETITVRQLAHKLAAALGVTPSFEQSPERPGDIRHSSADTALARELLGYRPAVSLDEGVSRIAAARKSSSGAGAPR
jgi:UDP-glucose 4-epimerase